MCRKLLYSERPISNGSLFMELPVQAQSLLLNRCQQRAWLSTVHRRRLHPLIVAHRLVRHRQTTSPVITSLPNKVFCEKNCYSHPVQMLNLYSFVHCHQCLVFWCLGDAMAVAVTLKVTNRRNLEWNILFLCWVKRFAYAKRAVSLFLAYKFFIFFLSI